MHCETLLKLSIEEVNFTSVRKTNIALSVLKAKQLHRRGSRILQGRVSNPSERGTGKKIFRPQLF